MLVALYGTFIDQLALLQPLFFSTIENVLLAVYRALNGTLISCYNTYEL
jgi:hypothetical protein